MGLLNLMLFEILILAYKRYFFSLKPRIASCIFALNCSAQGVTISVRIVAKLSPNTMAVDKDTHHCVEGAPILISRVKKSTFI